MDRPTSGKPLDFGTTSISNGSTALNPFGGFGGLVTSSSTAPNPFGGFSGLVTSSATAPNPFGGFSGLITSSATVSSAAIFSPLNAYGTISTAVPNGNFEKNVSNVATGIVSSANPQILESDYKKKMRKLNTSILSWMDHQIIDNPLSIWKDGLKVTRSCRFI